MLDTTEMTRLIDAWEKASRSDARMSLEAQSAGDDLMRALLVIANEARRKRA